MSDPLAWASLEVALLRIEQVRHVRVAPQIVHQRRERWYVHMPAMKPRARPATAAPITMWNTLP